MSGRWARQAMGTVSVVLILFAAAVGVAGYASAAATGQVYLVQALAGVTATVLVDGTAVQSAAAPKSVIGPLDLTAGQHVVEVRSGASSLVSARFTVAAADSLDVVAHRAADKAMTPVVTVFRNDLGAVAPGKTRLVVSPVAVAEPADIRLDGQSFFRNVANGESLSLVVPAKSYAVDVVATAGTGRVILAPVRTTLQPGSLTRVFVFGNPDEKTTDAIVQVLPVPVTGAGRPSSVHTGDGGQAADQFVRAWSMPWPWIAAAAALLGLTGLAGTAVGARRSARPTLAVPARVASAGGRDGGSGRHGEDRRRRPEVLQGSRPRR